MHTINGRQESQDNTVLEEPLEVKSSAQRKIWSDQVNQVCSEAMNKTVRFFLLYCLNLHIIPELEYSTTGYHWGLLGAIVTDPAKMFLLFLRGPLCVLKGHNKIFLIMDGINLHWFLLYQGENETMVNADAWN